MKPWPIVQHTTYVIFIGLKFIFCGFYRCVNAGESFTNWVKARRALCYYCEWFAGVYTSIKSTQVKFIPYNSNFVIKILLLSTLLHVFWASGRKKYQDSCSWNLSKCKTFSPTSQIVRNKVNDEELEVFSIEVCIVIFSSPEPKAHKVSLKYTNGPSSVRRRRPHFQTWISLKPCGQSWSNFMCSITGVGERLHKVLGQIGLKLWVPLQQKAPIGLQWGKRCLHLFSVVFNPILFILAGNEDMHQISDEFEFRPDWTIYYEVSCPWASKKFP